MSNETKPRNFQQLAIDPRLHAALKIKADREGRKLGRLAEDILWPAISAELQPADVRDRLADKAA